jgi:hypothetical protein
MTSSAFTCSQVESVMVGNGLPAGTMAKDGDACLTNRLPLGRPLQILPGKIPRRRRIRSICWRR